MSNYGIYQSLGYQQVGVDTSTALTVPDKTAFIIVTPQTQACRWRDDGVAPTAAIGYTLAVGQELRYDSSSMVQLRFISQVAGCILNVTYYGKNV